MSGLDVEPDDGETERYGKTVADLQSGVAVNGNGTITGTLKYVTGYTGFSGDTSKQSGNFLALNFDLGEDESLSIMLGEKGPIDATEDKYLVARIDDRREKLKLTVTVNDEIVEERIYDLGELVLETA